MNKRRLIFLSVFGSYHLCSFLITVYMDVNSKDLSILFKLFEKITIFKYGALFGLILFGVEVFWTWRDKKESEKQVEAMRHENNTLKAKVYDLTEAAKK